MRGLVDVRCRREAQPITGPPVALVQLLLFRRNRHRPSGNGDDRDAQRAVHHAPNFPISAVRCGLLFITAGPLPASVYLSFTDTASWRLALGWPGHLHAEWVLEHHPRRGPLPALAAADGLSVGIKPDRWPYVVAVLFLSLCPERLPTASRTARGAGLKGSRLRGTWSVVAGG